MKKFPLILVLISCVSMLFAQENVVIIYEDAKPNKNFVLPTNEFAISIGDNMFDTQITEEASRGFGSYTLSYHNRLKKWFWYGAYLNVFPTQRYNWGGGWYDYETERWIESPVRDYYSTKISLAPSVRFSYLNKPLITLYSGISLGWGLLVNENRDNRLSFFYHATLFGFSVGKKFFVGGEIGMGYRGLYSINAGYRF